jgi:phosphatidylglycerophosphate synthase
VTGSKLMPAAITLFGVGLLAIIAVFGLYAAGERNLTVWLYIAAMLLPVGLALAVFSVVRRRGR